ncbi:hypothetical protein BRCON_2772 [Candidatus Sumerlaea chitinivorans]|uniref:Uncharacterized protein n=1 Tax=Sumerlaea chitinivorans TaxID=2250252 RepID=A0A2Z4Y8E1_SUMC1|nr:hypothetical protein BRCON_2772 [Candidatus Sumerlaea chitinivorans]
MPVSHLCRLALENAAVQWWKARKSKADESYITQHGWPLS